MTAKKKNQKSKKTLISKIFELLKTPKAKVIATLLVFMVLGGGIMVYRSFAALPVWIYETASNSIDLKTSGGSCYTSTTELRAEVSNKNSPYIASLGCANNPDSPSSAKAQTTNMYFGSSMIGYSYTACTSIKGTGTAHIAFVTPNGRRDFDFKMDPVSESSENGTPACSDALFIASQGPAFISVTIDNKKGSSHAAVRNIRLTQVVGSQSYNSKNPSPKPLPSTPSPTPPPKPSKNP